MRKLITLFLVTLMVVTSVFAEEYVDFSSLWDEEKQVMTPSDEELYEAAIYGMTCPEDEKVLILELVSVFKEQLFCVEWAEEHFKSRDGHELTLTYEEYEIYMKMRDSSVKHNTAVLDAYDALVASRK